MVIWKDLAKVLSVKNHVVLIDLPGHGKTSKPIGRYPPARMAYAVLDTIKQLKLEQPILIGNSLGGATAIEVALMAPEQIKAISLLGAPGGDIYPELLLRMVESLSRPSQIQTVSPGMAHFLWWFVAQTLNPLSFETVDASWTHPRHNQDWALFARATSASLQALLRWRPPVEKIKVPTLVIQGTTDLVVWKGRTFSATHPTGRIPRYQRLWTLPAVTVFERLKQSPGTILGTADSEKSLNFTKKAKSS